jgi:hypothetical protein
MSNRKEESYREGLQSKEPHQSLQYNSSSYRDTRTQSASRGSANKRPFESLSKPDAPIQTPSPSMQQIARTVTNSFLIVLHFYDNYYKSKINQNDFSKILNKYKSNPSQLLLDLRKKYEVSGLENKMDLYKIPDEISSQRAFYLIEKHRAQLPKMFFPLIKDCHDIINHLDSCHSFTQRDLSSMTPPSSSSTLSTTQTQRHDILSTDFDPDLVLSIGSRDQLPILSSIDFKSLIEDKVSVAAYQLDNLTKAENLLLASRHISLEKIDGVKVAKWNQQILLSSKVENFTSVLEENIQYLKDKASEIISKSNVELQGDPTALIHTESSNLKSTPKAPVELNRFGQVRNLEKRHLLDQIYVLSVPVYSNRDYLGIVTEVLSPLALVYEFMLKKERVRIILRRKNW